jgi:hypothetical protein
MAPYSVHLQLYIVRSSQTKWRLLHHFEHTSFKSGLGIEVRNRLVSTALLHRAVIVSSMYSALPGSPG